MKLKEFIEKFCEGFTNIKIRRVTKVDNLALPYMVFRANERYMIFETEAFILIEDMEVIRVRVEDNYLVILIKDEI